MNSVLVRLVDPVLKEIRRAVLKKTNIGYQLENYTDSDFFPESDLYLSPGWIDFHAHVYYGISADCLDPDAIGLRTGVHLVVDAGSAGHLILDDLRNYIVPSASTQVKAFLNICSIGLVNQANALASPDFIDVERTVKAVIMNRPFICGIKAFAAANKVGELGTLPLKLALMAAKEAKVPVMVHIGEGPPLIEEVLDLLRSGDILTHCFHGKVGTPWEKNGIPIPAMREAIARGVILDVAHGRASFCFDTCQRALAAGTFPNIISTDLHGRSIAGVHDLATTMTKILACGMPLESVIAAVTLAPAKLMGLEHWCTLDGTLNRATLFRIHDGAANDRVYKDTEGKQIISDKVIVPAAIITGTEYISLDLY